MPVSGQATVAGTVTVMADSIGLCLGGAWGWSREHGVGCGGLDGDRESLSLLVGVN